MAAEVVAAGRETVGPTRVESCSDQVVAIANKGAAAAVGSDIKFKAARQHRGES